MYFATAPCLCMCSRKLLCSVYAAGHFVHFAFFDLPSLSLTIGEREEGAAGSSILCTSMCSASNEGRYWEKIDKNIIVNGIKVYILIPYLLFSTHNITVNYICCKCADMALEASGRSVAQNMTLSTFIRIKCCWTFTAL
jgi:hypothetical protein